MGSRLNAIQLLDFGCLHAIGPDGGLLHRTHHYRESEMQVRGRVRDIQVLRPGQSAQQVHVHRLPSVQAVRGRDAEDDGQLEAHSRSWA